MAIGLLFVLLSTLLWTISEGFGSRNLVLPLPVARHHPKSGRPCNGSPCNGAVGFPGNPPVRETSKKPNTVRFAEDPQSSSSSLSVTESDQVVLGVSGTVAALIVFYSEYTLKATGCGLPAGPFGLLGAAEGVSYLLVLGLVAFSLLTKVKTGSGLPAGPGGILGAAEGLSFLAIAAGLVALAFQIADYGYIPNAIPMEGGMCS